MSQRAQEGAGLKEKNISEKIVQVLNKLRHVQTVSVRHVLTPSPESVRRCPFLKKIYIFLSTMIIKMIVVGFRS